MEIDKQIHFFLYHSKDGVESRCRVLWEHRRMMPNPAPGHDVSCIMQDKKQGWAIKSRAWDWGCCSELVEYVSSVDKVLSLLPSTTQPVWAQLHETCLKTKQKQKWKRRKLYKKNHQEEKRGARKPPGLFGEALLARNCAGLGCGTDRQLK